MDWYILVNPAQVTFPDLMIGPFSTKQDAEAFCQEDEEFLASYGEVVDADDEAVVNLIERVQDPAGAFGAMIFSPEEDRLQRKKTHQDE